MISIIVTIIVLLIDINGHHQGLSVRCQSSYIGGKDNPINRGQGGAK
ncbi:MAG: hypothetical protein P4K83_09130 [Terracidiphilus sp.]|nr:hypothetical protein [Terracidiphilus sp.]